MNQVCPEFKIESLGAQNRGLFYERTEVNPLEKSFAELWQRENMERHYLNYGQGLLQDLMMHHNPEFPFQRSMARASVEINTRDRFVVATVVQWLGTNCGMSFLGEALREGGFRIERDPNFKPKDNQ
jgi:hypothetical protein